MEGVPHSTHSSGFTLIEVVITLALVSVLVAGTAGLLTVASMGMRLARNSTTAALLAQQKIEQFGGSPAALPAGTAQDYLAADGTPAPASSAFFIRRWTIAPVAASSGLVLVTIEVLVSGGNRAADVQGLIGPGGA
jgi:prepilin-type N-terminal cleavage/methylation domain-containing protein